MIRLVCVGSAMLLFFSSVAQAVAAHSLVDSHEYEYDAVSNIVERTSGGVTTEFGYDLVGQLISETRNGYSASYTYDANGNRLTRTVNSVTEEYEYDGADKLLEVSINSQTVKEFTYDAAGRTTSVTTSAGTTTLSWDYEDRLVGITYPSTATNAFSYNAFGARVSKTDSGGTSTYARNGVSVIAPVLSDGSLTYTPGISTNDGSDSTFSHGDIKNSLRQTNSNESTSATKQYDAFGNETTSTGTWQGPFQYGGPYGYQTDHDSGLKLLGHRYYDPSMGRFITQDVAKSGRNWYTYVSGRPTGAFDAPGLRKRSLTENEALQVDAAIKWIDNLGYADAAQELRNLRRLDLIRVDDGMYGYGSYEHNAFSHNRLWLSPFVIPDFTNSARYDKGKKIKRDQYFEDVLWLAAILYHEYIHGEQFKTYKMFSNLMEKVTGVNPAERGAWGKTIDFLKYVRDLQTDDDRKRRAQNLYDKARLIRADY